MAYYLLLLLVVVIIHADVDVEAARTLDTRATQCDQDTLERSFVTQCGPSLCEPLLEDSTFKKSNETLNQKRRDSEWPRSSDEVVQIVSSRAEHRFKVITHKAMNTDTFYYEESHVNGSLFVDTNVKYQRVLGFGTTLSDASCKNVDDLPDEIRSQLISDYFQTAGGGGDQKAGGIGLNLLRVPIGSTRYSYSNYVLDQPDSQQVELSPYDLDHRIPLVKDILKAAGRLKNRVKLLASSDGAPAEMKQNNKIVHGGFLRQDKFLDYASYLTGFISAYKSQGLNIWALILSDAPATNARIGASDASDEALDYNSLALRPSDSIKLIRSIQQVRNSQSRPQLSDNNNKFRLLLLGDSRAYIPVWADAVLRFAETANNVAGIAYTCQQPTKTSTDSQPFQPYDNLVYATKRYPNKYLLAAQGSNHAQIKMGNWQYAENYATEIVKNLEFGSVGWVDFNMALNLEGGPCISDRFKSDASVLIDPKRGIYYRNPMFYAIGHLSRYVKPGSIRVKVDFLSSAHMFNNQYIAFVTPDNYLIVFVANNNIGPMPVNIGINRITKVQTLLDTKSFNTFIFRL